MNRDWIARAEARRLERALARNERISGALLALREAIDRARERLYRRHTRLLVARLTLERLP